MQRVDLGSPVLIPVRGRGRALVEHLRSRSGSKNGNEDSRERDGARATNRSWNFISAIKSLIRFTTEMTGKDEAVTYDRVVKEINLKMYSSIVRSVESTGLGRS